MSQHNLRMLLQIVLLSRILFKKINRNLQKEKRANHHRPLPRRLLTDILTKIRLKKNYQEKSINIGIMFHWVRINIKISDWWLSDHLWICSGKQLKCTEIWRALDHLAVIWFERIVVLLSLFNCDWGYRSWAWIAADWISCACLFIFLFAFENSQPCIQFWRVLRYLADSWTPCETHGWSGP